MENADLRLLITRSALNVMNEKIVEAEAEVRKLVAWKDYLLATHDIVEDCNEVKK